MKNIGEWHLIGRGDAPDIYISGDDDHDTDDIRLSFVGSQVQFWCDMPPQRLQKLAEMIEEVLGDEQVREKLREEPLQAARCASCGAAIHPSETLCGECACEDDCGL